MMDTMDFDPIDDKGIANIEDAKGQLELAGLYKFIALSLVFNGFSWIRPMTGIGNVRYLR